MSNWGLELEVTQKTNDQQAFVFFFVQVLLELEVTLNSKLPKSRKISLQLFSSFINQLELGVT